IGADEFCDFLAWKEPDAILDLARLGVATRPGFPGERLDRVLERLARPDRVAFFSIGPLDVSSSEVRRRVGSGEPFEQLVPPEVASLIQRRGLYRGEGYTTAWTPQGDGTA